MGGLMGGFDRAPIIIVQIRCTFHTLGVRAEMYYVYNTVSTFILTSIILWRLVKEYLSTHTAHYTINFIHSVNEVLWRDYNVISCWCEVALKKNRTFSDWLFLYVTSYVYVCRQNLHLRHLRSHSCGRFVDSVSSALRLSNLYFHYYNYWRFTFRL